MHKFGIFDIQFVILTFATNTDGGIIRNLGDDPPSKTFNELSQLRLTLTQTTNNYHRETFQRNFNCLPVCGVVWCGVCCDVCVVWVA